VRSNVSGAAIEDDASHPEKLCNIGTNDLGRYGVAGSPLFELQELPQLAILGLGTLKLMNLLAKTRVLVGESFVFLFYINEIDVVREEILNAARAAGDYKFNGGTDLQKRMVHAV
jgi:hypothetical protein